MELASKTSQWFPKLIFAIFLVGVFFDKLLRTRSIFTSTLFLLGITEMKIWLFASLSVMALAIFSIGCSSAEEFNQDKPKLPDLDSKEWKELKDGNGLKIWDVKEGKGDAVKAGATVTIHYTGWTKDGNVFDSSVVRGQKATFPLNRLIKGWQVGIPGMKPGGVRRLYIPYDLAYGAAGRPPQIPAKADLIFEIELFDGK